MSKELTVEQVIRALKRLNKGWPKDLTLLSMDGNLYLACGELYPDAAGDADMSVIIEDFPNIFTDGGGF